MRLFAELVSNVDKEWQPAIETFLGKKRFDIIVDGKYCAQVMNIVHDHQLRDIKVVITDKLPKTEITPESAAKMLDIRMNMGEDMPTIFSMVFICARILMNCMSIQKAVL